MLPYAELVDAVAIVPRATLHLACDPVTALAEVGSVFSHPDRLSLNPANYIEAIDTSLSLSQRLP